MFTHYLIFFLVLPSWLTRRSRVEDVSSVEPVPVPESLVRLRVEHPYYEMTDNVLAFCEIWTG